MNLGVGIALILLVSIGGNYILFSRLQDTKESLKTIQEKVDKIGESQKINNEEIASLNKKQADLILSTRASNAMLQKLKADMPDVKAYLETPIPPAVGKLLNDARLSDQ